MVETNEREELEAILRNQEVTLLGKEEERDDILKEIDEVKRELVELGEDLGQNEEHENI